jgi:undecaprenyl-diphosphatase
MLLIYYAVLLGVLQGVTEFLPVSSSGHLALAQLLLPGFEQPGLILDVAFHVGTAAAVVVLEWDRILEAIRSRYAGRLVAQLAVATVATGVVALPLRGTAEGAFHQPILIAAGLAVTGLLLLMLKGQRPGAGPERMMWPVVLLVGLVQGFAVMPGVSRSGSTIVAGVLGGLERRWAADFSFLLSVPAIMGAAIVEGWTQRAALAVSWPVLWPAALIGAGVAAVTGAAAIVVVRKLVQAGQLRHFAWYVLPLAVVVVTAHLRGWL